MQEFPSEFKPYLGLGLILVGALPLSHVIAEGAAAGSISLKAVLGCGIFLLLGIILVLERFVGRRFLMLLLFLFGWMFFSGMAFVVLVNVVPLLAMFGAKPGASAAIIAIGSLAFGPVGAIGFYWYQKRKPDRIPVRPDRRGRTAPLQDDLHHLHERHEKPGPDDAAERFSLTITGKDRIKPAGQSLYGLASEAPEQPDDDDAPPPAAG